MIAVTDLHSKPLYVNAELIERVESTPDTQIVLTNGRRIYVTEEPEEIVARIVLYRRACLGWEATGPAGGSELPVCETKQTPDNQPARTIGGSPIVDHGA